MTSDADDASGSLSTLSAGRTPFRRRLRVGLLLIATGLVLALGLWPLIGLLDSGAILYVLAVELQIVGMLVAFAGKTMLLVVLLHRMLIGFGRADRGSGASSRPARGAIRGDGR